MISIVINADTRPGCGAEVNTTGDHGSGSLMGVRSWDFLTEGVRNKLIFFSGHSVELVLYVDEHEPIPPAINQAIGDIAKEFHLGENFKFVCKPHQRSEQRWNELLYLEALKLATGDYIAHFDSDSVAFRDPNSDIVNRYIGFLESDGYNFICQPTTLSREEHGMWWASTRFFICKHNSINPAEIEHCIRNEGYRASMYGHCPALEHVLGRMAGAHGVFYPPADWSDYMVFSWSRYHKGLLAKLNRISYQAQRDYVLACGIHGPNDVISLPLIIQ